MPAIEKTVHIKLIKGFTHQCPDGTKLTAKCPAGPFPESHPVVRYARKNRRKFQVYAHVDRKRPASRSQAGGRGGRGMPDVVSAPEREVVGFGAEIESLMTLTRTLLIERNVSHDLGIKVTSSVAKRALCDAIFDAEQDMLREPAADDSSESDEVDVPDLEPKTPPRRRKRSKSADTNTEGE